MQLGIKAWTTGSAPASFTNYEVIISDITPFWKSFGQSGTTIDGENYSYRRMYYRASIVPARLHDPAIKSAWETIISHRFIRISDSREPGLVAVNFVWDGDSDMGRLNQSNVTRSITLKLISESPQ